MSPRHDLPPELLAIISGRLHDAADYVRFHAVCKPWRESLPASTALRPVFFPWLVAPSFSRCPLDMKFRCVFSKTSYRAEAPRVGHNWVARPDGTAAWFFSAFTKPTLVDPFTGDATALPPFVGGDDERRMGMENSGGVLYDDGTVFLYNFLYNFFADFMILEDHDEDIEERLQVVLSSSFRAAILRPGDTAWKFVDRVFDLAIDEQCLRKDLFFAAHRVHNGNTLVRVHRYADTWNLLPPPIASEDKPEMTWGIWEDEVVTGDWYLESSHVLESRGELLRVCVLIKTLLGKPAAHDVSVSVHALEEEVGADGRRTLHWARRDGRSFADRVMFLGCPNSFAVEASRFHGDASGGWVYFLQRRSDVHGLPLTRPRVFRYNLVYGMARFMERLPPELVLIGAKNDEEFLWLLPQPVIATIQVIRKRLESPKTGGPTQKISIFRLEEQKHSKEPFIRLVVRNLPPGIDSSQLRHFFNTHGEVSSAEVTSLGKGYVTMAMSTLHKPYEIEDALDGLVLDGFTLRVSEATKMTGSCVRFRPVEQ